ncbi:Dolichyl-phosphate beta-glucosyltransferase [Toxocara canis]|uniref:dolichyl-phosphate beta-glucosyltransferase n=1 Tax=Toxocara canis TaxID=6265 RepID=A0A0B2W098_TOXCA|nr:Dolichyl-phosphate beta-glucosyltransferase [Toxocara canis]
MTDLIVVFGIALLSFILFAIGALFMLSGLTPWPKRTRRDLLRKVFAYDPTGVEQDQFACLLHESPDSRPRHTQPSRYLSVVVPAMNEKDRLPSMLDECFTYLQSRSKKDSWFIFEVIVVDDGSTDRTSDVAFKYSTKYGNDVVKVLKLEQNRGKGGAVRCGVMCCRGAMILFADADGATRFEDLEKLENEILRSTTADGSLPKDIANFDWSFPAIAVGSRAHMEAESIATRSVARTLLMIGFHVLVYLFTVRTIRDTQCGFKLFTRGAAARLFPILHIERWAFDVELLYLAERYGYPIREVAVTWHEVDGSKIVPVWSWIQMGRDLILIWFRYYVGIWRSDVTV